MKNCVRSGCYCKIQDAGYGGERRKEGCEKVKGNKRMTKNCAPTLETLADYQQS